MPVAYTAKIIKCCYYSCFSCTILFIIYQKIKTLLGIFSHCVTCVLKTFIFNRNQ